MDSGLSQCPVAVPLSERVKVAFLVDLEVLDLGQQFLRAAEMFKGTHLVTSVASVTFGKRDRNGMR
jgi:hypothetical protein